MTDRLVVYAYNVLFGDAILVEVPEGGTRRFILIDVGNVLSGQGGKNPPLLEAVQDIKRRAGGKIDLYIMTHEHLDHVEGLLYAKENSCELRVDTVWMTASADPNYHATHPEARRKRLELQRAVEAFQAAVSATSKLKELDAVFQMNGRTTEDCVDFLRRLSPKLYYPYRGYEVEDRHPFTESTLRILAPEEDTSVYYESVAHLEPSSGSPAVAGGRPLPLPGIDGGAFYQLIDRMDNGLSESLFAIDRAANDTSLVVELTWRGRRLLFTGDAELKSWRKMAEKNLLRPLDLLKVGHHGSRNATPSSAILDQVLPPDRRASAVAVLSTCPNVYQGVPDPRTLEALKARTKRIYKTTDVPPGKPVIVRLEGLN